MFFDQAKKDYLKRMIIRAARLPVVYFIIGIALIALSYSDNILPVTQYEHILDIADNIGAIFIALSFVTFIYSMMIHTFRHYEMKLFDEHQIAALILASIRKSLRIIFILVVLNIIITLIGPTKDYLLLANNIIKVTIIAAIGWITIQILYTFEAVISRQMATLAKTDSRRAKSLYTKTHIIRNILTVVIALFTFAAILMSFSSVRNIGISLLASAGFLTAIIGLGSQKTLISLFSGMQIALSQPIRMGDIVVIENETGVVEEITFTHVIMRVADRRRMILPITYFLDRSFINWSHDIDGMRGSINLYVDYMMPIQPLRDYLTEILAASTYWDKKISKLTVGNITERSVELHIALSAANEDDLADLRAEVREKMLAFIREKYPEYFPSLGISRTYDLTTDENLPELTSS